MSSSRTATCRREAARKGSELMEGYQWIHPAVAIITLLLLTATAYAKMGPKTYFRAHYALAITTVIGILFSFGLAARPRII